MEENTMIDGVKSKNKVVDVEMGMECLGVRPERRFRVGEQQEIKCRVIVTTL